MFEDVYYDISYALKSGSGYEKAYYIRVCEVGQGNDYFILHKSKRVLKRVLKSLEKWKKAWFDEYQRLIEESKEPVDELTFWDMAYEELNMILNSFVKEDGVYIFSEDSGYYYKATPDALLVYDGTNKYVAFLYRNFYAYRI